MSYATPSRLSKLLLNQRNLPSGRPAASKNVQPLCSQFCSQRDLQLSGERKEFHGLTCPVSPGCDFGDRSACVLPALLIVYTVR